MLVLSRKKGESIMIGDQVELVVVAIEGDTIRLGIQAPKNVEIHRKEVYLTIQNANKEASSQQVNLGQLVDMLRNKQI
jgi:carbon storage regulator